MSDEKPIDPSQKLKEVQISMLDKLAGGGMNQNDVLALMSMMNQGGEKTSMQDTMNMMLMMRMMNPQPQKQDQTTPLMMWLMMDGMKKPNGDSDIDKKIEALQKAIEKKEEDSKFKEVLTEIKEMQKNKEAIGIKDILNIVANKDNTIEAIRGIANEKDRELLMTQFSGQVGALQEEIKKVGTGGDINKVVETIKALKQLSNDIGLDKVGQKSKEEVLTGLVSHVADALAPAINQYAARMNAPQPQSMTQEQAVRLAQIQAQRQQAQPAQVQSQEPEKPEVQRDEFGNVIFPDMIDIADSRGRQRRP
jgi:hypothetical protein